MKLVGHGDQNHVHGFAPEPFEVSLLPLEPRRLRDHVGVAQAEHHLHDLVVKPSTDLALRHLVRLILDRVVQNGRYRLVLAAAPFDDRPGDDQQMADVGDLSTLAGLCLLKVS